MQTCNMPSNLVMPRLLRSLNMSGLPPERVVDNCAAEIPEICSVARNLTLNIRSLARLADADLPVWISMACRMTGLVLSRTMLSLNVIGSMPGPRNRA